MESSIKKRGIFKVARKYDCYIFDKLKVKEEGMEDNKKSQKQKEQLRGYRKDRKKDPWLERRSETDKDRVDRWTEETEEDQIAPI